jgi:hypothetical protein
MNTQIEINEKIALLALQASDRKTGWLDRQKFAELIIKECAVALENNKANLTTDSLCDAIWEIKDHFGIVDNSI